MALWCARTHGPTVILLDLNMPGRPSLLAIGDLLEAAPGAAVVVMIEHDDPEYARSALLGGASGFVLKEAAQSELVDRGARGRRRPHLRHPPHTRRATGHGLVSTLDRARRPCRRGTRSSRSARRSRSPHRRDRRRRRRGATRSRSRARLLAERRTTSDELLRRDLQDVPVGETGFEPATARPPAGRIQARPRGFGWLERVGVVLSWGQLRSIWTPDWTPSEPPPASTACEHPVVSGRARRARARRERPRHNRVTARDENLH